MYNSLGTTRHTKNMNNKDTIIKLIDEIKDEMYFSDCPEYMLKDIWDKLRKLEDFVKENC